MKTYTVYRHYTYAEMFFIDAENEQEAIEKLDDGLMDGTYDEPDDIFQEFDFYDSHETDPVRRGNE